MYVITEYQYQQLRNRYPEDEVIRQEIGNQLLSDHKRGDQGVVCDTSNHNCVS